MATKRLVVESRVEKGKEMQTYSIPTVGGGTRHGTGTPPVLQNNNGCLPAIAYILMGVGGVLFVILVGIISAASQHH